MTPEQLHREITSGRPAAAASLGEDLVQHSRTLDDACNDVLDGLTGVRWESGLAAIHFRVKGQDLYASISSASWRMFRLGDSLKDVATRYGPVVAEADRLLRTWQELPPEQKERPATEGSWLRALTTLKSQWSSYLDDLAADLLDDDDRKDVENEDGDTSTRQSDEDWVVRGAEKDFLSHLTNGTRRGPRIPNSYLNSGEDWVQQGLAYHDGQYLMSSYAYDPERTEGSDYVTDNPKSSNLTTVDATTGEETGSVSLAGPASAPHTQPQHSGGVTVLDGYVYVVSTEYEGDDKEEETNSPYVYKYKLSDVQQAGPGESVRAESRFAVPASSYISNDGENLYLGRFSDDGPGELYTVDPDQRGALEAGYDPPMDSVSTPQGVNGATVLPDRIVYSQNHGRGEPSTIIEQPRGVPYLFGSFADRTSTGSLVEENTLAGDDLAFLGEAGARAYSPVDDESGDADGTDDLWAQSHLTIAPGAGGAGGMDIEVEPQSLRSASRTFADVSDGVSGVRGSARGVELPSSTLGEVPGASALSSAVSTQATKFGDDLGDAENDAETVFDGLRWCADGYEISDHESYSALESFTGMLGLG